MNEDQLLVLLKEKCESHDWYYNYSDDHRAFRKGMDESNEIYLIEGMLDDMGSGGLANLIIKSYNTM